MSRVAIVDYGLGNLFSVERAFAAVGASAAITADPADLEGADGVVIPGVGAFGEGIQNLEARGLAAEIRRLAAAGKPTLGICLGMQLLMDESEELGTWRGLGLIPGRVVQLPRGNPQGDKVPQIGWNSVEHPTAATSSWAGTLLNGVEPGAFVYFVHSFWVQVDEPGDMVAETDYAGTRFCSVAARGSIWGCQFHPEKSGDPGLRVIRNFVASLPQDGEAR